MSAQLNGSPNGSQKLTAVPTRQAGGKSGDQQLPPKDYEKLLEDLQLECVTGARSVGILGLTSITLRLLADLAPTGLLGAVEAIYTAGEALKNGPRLSIPVRPFTALSKSRHDVLVVAANEDKETLLEEAVPFVSGVPKVILSGYGHFTFRDRAFREELEKLLVPSLANGYPNSLVHLYQCLANAARLGLRGVVAEFGVFKGGTTMFLSRVIERLGMDWPIIGFDTFCGFPPRRTILDMYDHPDCVYYNVEEVKHYLRDRKVELVSGDILKTCHTLDAEDLVLTFIDTDNYTPAKAALEVARQRTVIGGAIVFDHFTGVDRFRYTLGERMAARSLLDDARYFNLHGTGVFYRQR